MLNAKNLRNNYHFVLYDYNDNALYYDTFEEFNKDYNIRISDIIYKLKYSTNNVITLLIDNLTYYLYVFNDDVI